MSQIVITSKKEKVMPLKRNVTALRKIMILKIVKRIRVLMIEMLMSQRNFMKHGAIFLYPLMRLKLWENGTKRSKRLWIDHLMKWFVKAENSDFDSIEMSCLKPRVSYSTVMEDTLNHLPDIGFFKIQDVVDGPLVVLPLRGKKWNLPHCEHIAANFREVSGLDRETLKNIQQCKHIYSHRLHRTCMWYSFLFHTTL